ncbi:MAG: D-galactonate dehydratase, partial [Dokdonella sp.]|nr:D-galactonate dehydratase [Dokdonella sp.]
MKITRIETLSLGEFPNIVWVLVHTDNGLVGLGETFYGAAAVSAYVHETLAPQMLGQDPLRIEAHSRKLLQNYVGFKSTGAEIRGASAFDIALWDIWGKAT